MGLQWYEKYVLTGDDLNLLLKSAFLMGCGVYLATSSSGYPMETRGKTTSLVVEMRFSLKEVTFLLFTWDRG